MNNLLPNQRINKIMSSAILVVTSIKSRETNTDDMDVFIEELTALTQAAGAEVLGVLMQNIHSVNPATYIGKGKLEELCDMVHNMEANIVIFDQELSGSQIRNLEDVLTVKVIDRTMLILDIFAIRAKTKVAKLQIELAQLKYTLPRLSSVDEGLSRTGAGIGTRGAGEQKLELNRRKIRDKIIDIKRRIKEADKIRHTQSEQRLKNDIPIVAVAGYTNAGKSTFMNRCIQINDGSEDKYVFEKDMLFATLDTTNRRIDINASRPFILVDTVGFVSKLPHALVNAFKSTLDEILQADLILHMVDASSVYALDQIHVTNTVLKELGAEQIPQIIVYNKIDKVDYFTINDALVDKVPTIKISAKTGKGIDELVAMIETMIYSDCEKVHLLIPFKNAGIYDKICKCGNMIKTDYLVEGISVEVELDQKNINRYSEYRV